MPVLNDLILPFSVGGGAVRGRLVRLGPLLDTILDRQHGYPQSVAALLAETVALAAALAGALKFEGVFTLQAQGKGAVSLLVADVTSEGHVRAHARFDQARLADAEKGGGAPVPRLLGEGYLAFTVDQGPDTERYQGIVALEGDTLEDCAVTYFRQSEQLETAFRAAVRPSDGTQGWTAGVVMIQRMPAGAANAPILVAEDAEEGWNRASILLGSLKDGELLDDGLTPEHLLYRLYHADQLQGFTPKGLEARCRCSTERVRAVLASLPGDELIQLADPSGNVAVSCEFCCTTHVVPVAEAAP